MRAAGGDTDAHPGHGPTSAHAPVKVLGAGWDACCSPAPAPVDADHRYTKKIAASVSWPAATGIVWGPDKSLPSVAVGLETSTFGNST